MKASNQVIEKVQAHPNNKKRLCSSHILKNRVNYVVETRCTKKAKELRIWANHRLEFCQEHADLWDTVVTKALTGDWGDEEENAVQVKGNS